MVLGSSLFGATAQSQDLYNTKRTFGKIQIQIVLGWPLCEGTAQSQDLYYTKESAEKFRYKSLPVWIQKDRSNAELE